MNTQLKVDQARDNVMHLQEELKTLRSFSSHIHGPQLGVVKRMINRTYVALLDGLTELADCRRITIEEYIQLHQGEMQKLDYRIRKGTLKSDMALSIYQAGLNQELQKEYKYSLIESLNILNSATDEVEQRAKEGRSVIWTARHLHIQYNKI